MSLRDLHDGVSLSGSFPLPSDVPFTRREALLAGLTHRELADLVEGGFLRRPLRNVYVATALGDSLMLRCMCLAKVVPADAVICDGHAGWSHGAEMMFAPGEHLSLRPISVFMPPGRRLRNDLSDSGERALLSRDVEEIHGLRVTTPLRTALDVGRHRYADRSLAALDQMFRLRVFTREELLAELGRFKGMRWVTTLRAMAVLADPRAESPPESVLRLRWIEAGIFEPEPQLEVWTQDGFFVARLDLGNRQALFGAEFDGLEWHGSPVQLRHDRDRRAEASEQGYRIEVFTKETLWGPGADAELRLRVTAAEHLRARGNLVRW